MWAFLPERAKRSLINADRDWFAGLNIRNEAILNELRIATEELLLYRFWKPLDDYTSRQIRDVEIKVELENLKNELTREHRVLKLNDFEKVCRMHITDEFLKYKSIDIQQIHWFSNELPESLCRLRRDRNRAEHESGGQLTRYGIGKYWAEFIGIAQEGVLPRLVKLLYFKS